MTDFGLYLVMTNPKVGYVACAEAAVRAGVKILQLRMKHRPRAEVVATGHAVRAVTRGTGTLFIVNDDPSIAVEVAADGVHVGQDDMPVAEVRARFPSLGLVGLSTHNPAQARAAIAQAPDYIGVVPVRATPTKDIPDPTLGGRPAGPVCPVPRRLHRRRRRGTPAGTSARGRAELLRRTCRVCRRRSLRRHRSPPAG